MPAPRNRTISLIVAVLMLAAMTPVATLAGPPPAPAPDYGGRDSGPVEAAGEAAPNPAASAGRALEALVVVLAGVAGTVYALKRFNLVQPGAGGKPARIALTGFGRPPANQSSSAVSVISSSALPGGAMLHVVQVGPKTLLLAATASSVSAVAEWPTATEQNTGGMADEFEGYLTRADPSAPEGGAASGIAAANARLRSLLSPEEPF